MNLTKEKIILLRHSLDLMTRSEGSSLGQVGLSGLKNDRSKVLYDRLALAVEIDAEMEAEYVRLVEAEAVQPDASASDGGNGG